MIIKHINIKNYLSYYDDNFFEISEGLTLLLGDNGDGKTTFFDAVKWLLDTTTRIPIPELASAKAKSELAVGESMTVSVSMTFEHMGEKIVEKSFDVKRVSDTDFRGSNFSFRGYVESGTERISRSGEEIVNGCFDAFMQRFSMFKGESQLNVLNDATAFTQLINTYSDLKEFEPLVELTDSFAQKSYNVLEREKKNDSKTAAKATEISAKLSGVRTRIATIRDDIKTYSDSQKRYGQRLEILEKNQEASEKYNEIEERIKNKNNTLSTLKANRSSVNLNTALLDKQWILCAFPDILHEFQVKCSKFSKLKRQIEKDWNIENGVKKGKQEALKEVQAMIGEELRWDIPDKQTMEEMIAAEKCWVCGHPAPKGSDEYNYMVRRLEEYNKRLNPVKEPEVEEKCFVSEQIDELQTLALRLGGEPAVEVAKKALDIQERLELEAFLDGKIRELKTEIEEMNKEKARILLNSDGLTEDMLLKNMSDYMGLTKLKSEAESKLESAKRQLDEALEEEDVLKREMEQLPGTGMVNVYSKVNMCFEKIFKAFKGAKEANLTQFLCNLETTANKYLVRLNVDDYHGVIKLKRSINRNGETTATIDLYSTNGDKISHKSGSQEVTMYMSVLFAISELTTIAKSENYPLIFDAPASTFGDAKAGAFYNVVDGLDKQCIIVTKDFIDENHHIQMDSLNSLTCKVYQIRKAEGYTEDLSTVRTVITAIK